MHSNERGLDEDRIQQRLERLEAAASEVWWWRSAALVAVLLAAAAPLAASAVGPIPHVFAAGEVVSAEQMNENFAHLTDAVAAVEGSVDDLSARVPSSVCSEGQIPRFDGTTWQCSDDATITTTDPNLVLNADDLALSADLSVETVDADVVTADDVNAGVLDLTSWIQWNNSVSNSVPEMSVFSNAGTCDASKRGRIRLWQHEDIGNSQDIGDALCFCSRYVDRTPAVDETTYRWFCIYPRSDGD